MYQRMIVDVFLWLLQTMHPENIYDSKSTSRHSDIKIAGSSRTSPSVASLMSLGTDEQRSCPLVSIRTSLKKKSIGISHGFCGSMSMGTLRTGIFHLTFTRETLFAINLRPKTQGRRWFNVCVFLAFNESNLLQWAVSSLLSNNIAGLSRIHMALCGFKAKYGEPGNFGTGYWGRKIQDPAERLSAFIAWF